MINNKGKMNKNLVLVMMLLLSVGCKAEKIEMSEVPERGFYSTRPATYWGGISCYRKWNNGSYDRREIHIKGICRV